MIDVYTYTYIYIYMYMYIYIYIHVDVNVNDDDDDLTTLGGLLICNSKIGSHFFVSWAPWQWRQRATYGLYQVYVVMEKTHKWMVYKCL